MSLKGVFLAKDHAQKQAKSLTLTPCATPSKKTSKKRSYKSDLPPRKRTLFTDEIISGDGKVNESR